MIDGQGQCGVINYQEIAKRRFADPGVRSKAREPGSGVSMNVYLSGEDMNAAAPETAIDSIVGAILRVEISGAQGIKNKTLTFVIPDGLLLAECPGMESVPISSGTHHWIKMDTELPAYMDGGEAAYKRPIVYALSDTLDAIALEIAIAADDRKTVQLAPYKIQAILDGDSGDLPVYRPIDVFVSFGLDPRYSGEERRGIQEPETIDPRWSVDGGDSDCVDMTCGERAVFRLDIFNTLKSAGGGYEAYIPVPHAGFFYGDDFQDGAFEWNMALAEPPSLDAEQCDIDYTTDDITRGDAESANYRSAESIDADSGWSAVNMVRVRNKEDITPGETRSLLFTYAAADDRERAVPALVNAFNPVYRVEAPGIKGWRKGERVAATFAVGTISGRVWRGRSANDVGQGEASGCYNTVVKLRLPADGPSHAYADDAEIQGVYAGIDNAGKYAWTVTDRDGRYAFPRLPAGMPFDVQFVNPDALNLEFVSPRNANGAANSIVDPGTGVASRIDPGESERSACVNAGLCARKYRLLFDANGGVPVPEDADMARIVTRPALTINSMPLPPMRDNCEFAGWFDTPDETGGDEFKPSDRVTESKTLYARWTANKVRVTFSAGRAESGTLPASRANIVAGSTVPVLWDRSAPPLERLGYVFSGWSETDGGLPVEEITPSMDTTLYPVWREVAFDITFDPNGGEGEPVVVYDKSIGGAIMLSSCASQFSREGYRLLGFNTDPAAEKALVGTEGNLKVDEAMLAALYRNVPGDRQEGTYYAIWAREVDILECGIRPLGDNITCLPEKDKCLVWDISGLYQVRLRTDEEEEEECAPPCSMCRPRCVKPCSKPCSPCDDDFF